MSLFPYEKLYDDITIYQNHVEFINIMKKYHLHPALVSLTMDKDINYYDKKLRIQQGIRSQEIEELFKAIEIIYGENNIIQ
jgi:predicted CoA-binding protein